MTTRRQFLAGPAFILLSARAPAQTKPGTVKIGVLRWDQAQIESWKKLLSAALSKHGYVEGKNLAVFWRSADENEQRAQEILREFVREQVDVIVASPTPAAHAARNATASIPIVLGGIADPVSSGLVSNIARPGGNITGLSMNLPGVAGKRVEVLRDAFPSLRRIAFLGSSIDPATKVFLVNTERAAKHLGFTLHTELVSSSAEFETAFAKIASAGAQAVIVQPIFWAVSKRVSEIALKHRLPTISDFPAFARDGGLLSYGADQSDNARIVADYVDKILKGAKPGDLPIQEPTRFVLVVNLKTAKALGVTVAAFVLDRADEVIR